MLSFLLGCCTTSLLQLTCACHVWAAGCCDGSTDVDEVVIATVGQVVKTAVGFGERRQVEGEFCKRDALISKQVSVANKVL